MFGRKGLGNAAAGVQPTHPEPFRPAPGPAEAVFPRPAPEGDRGEAPSTHGVAPGEPIDRFSRDAVIRQLVEGMREVRATADQLTAVASCPIGPLHLLPPQLWEERFGPALLLQLDLSPYRPWNTIFLPLDAEGAFSLDLPVRPERFLPDVADVETNIEIILDIFAGRDHPEPPALELRLATIRQNFAHLFPTDRTDITPDVRQARANVRALAFTHATDSSLVDAAGIVSSHETFLVDPETQLIR